MRQTTAFVIKVGYDDRHTAPDALGEALDRLMETALSTPGILDDYGKVEIGRFEIPLDDRVETPGDPLQDAERTQEEGKYPTDTQGFREGPRVIARFIPQAWINDWAMDLDEGRVEFDCTEDILNMGRDQALAIQDDQLCSDSLVPSEILDRHDGPFRVEVEDAIRVFFAAKSTNPQ